MKCVATIIQNALYTPSTPPATTAAPGACANLATLATYLATYSATNITFVYNISTNLLKYKALVALNVGVGACVGDTTLPGVLTSVQA